MRPLLRGIRVLSLSIVPLLAMAQLAAPAYADTATSFTFNLLTGPHLTANPSTGFSLMTTGEGAFVVSGPGTVETHTTCSKPANASNPGPVCKTVFWGTGKGLSISGAGSWEIIGPDGTTVVDKGTWAATKFVSFTYWGRDNDGGGLLGGDLELLVTLASSNTGQPIAGGSDVQTSIICRAGDPPLPRSAAGFPPQTFVPGVTLPEYVFIVSLGFTQRIPFSSTIFHSDSVLPF